MENNPVVLPVNLKQVYVVGRPVIKVNGAQELYSAAVPGRLHLADESLKIILSIGGCLRKQGGRIELAESLSELVNISRRNWSKTGFGVRNTCLVTNK